MTDFNLASHDAVETTKDVIFDMEILHPVTEEPTGAFVQLVSAYDPEVRQISRSQANDYLKRSFQATRKNKEVEAPTIEDTERRTSKVLAAGTRGWFTKKPGGLGEDDIVEQGLPFGPSRLPFSRDNAEKLYSNPGYDWLATQVNKALNELGNFTKPSSTGSSPSPEISSN